MVDRFYYESKGRETMNSRQTRYLLGVNIWSMNFMKYVILLRGEELIAFNALGKHRFYVLSMQIESSPRFQD